MRIQNMAGYSSSYHILKVHWETPNTFWMRIEQHLARATKKCAKLGNRNKGFMLCWSRSILNAHRADLNIHKASSKRIQNKNDNLTDFGPKHKYFEDQYKIEERVQIFFFYQAIHVYTRGFWMTLLSGSVADPHPHGSALQMRMRTRIQLLKN